MAGIGVVGALKAIGTVVSVIGSIQQFQANKAAAKQAEMNAEAEAQWNEREAGLTQASKQREAIRAREEGKFISSRAGAIAAASGAGALDPSIVNIMGGIEEETDLRVKTALFEGEEGANRFNYQAGINRATGSARAASFRSKATGNLFSAGTTLLSGGADLYSKYSPRTSGSVSSPQSTTRMRSPGRTTRTGDPYR